MRIVDAKVIVTCPDRNFVTLKITTDDGLTGVGDATLNGRELAVASYLEDHVCQLLIGRDPSRIEDTWQFLYKGAYWRRGPVTMTAIAAVDTALWDIKGKTAGMPVYQLLGGRSRDGRDRVRPRQRHDHPGRARRGRPLPRPRLPRRPRAVRRAGPGPHLRSRQGTRVSTSRRRRVRGPTRRPGRPPSTCTSSQACSRPYASASDTTSTCCTTSTTGSRRSRRRGSARPWSRTRCSGSKTRSPKSCRRASG